jgi:3,4-dihydroxy-2-butanone 4-phosphate synthase
MNKFFKRIGWLLLLVLMFALPALAQTPVIEHGQPDELRGVTKVFVGIDDQQREVVVREIKKQLPDLEIVSRPDESDIHLLFSLKETRDGRTEAVGTVIKLIDANRARALYSFKMDMSPIYEEHSMKKYGIERIMPLTFAREFVRSYKKANS